MLNILHITTFLNGGAGKALVDLVNYQKNLGHNIRVVVNRREYGEYKHYPEHIASLKALGVKTDYYDSLFKRDQKLNKTAIKSLSQSLKNHAVFHLVHAHAAMPARIALDTFSAHREKPKFIQTMHGWGISKSRVMEKQDIKTMNSLDVVVSLNNSGKRLLLKKGLATSKIKIIPNGINSKTPNSKYFENQIESFIERDDWHLRFLCIGEIGNTKNQVFLLKALKDLELLGFKCCVVFIGPEQKKGYLARELTSTNTNHLTYWTGHIKDASSYMHYFDALILPSKSEGMPLSALEAFRAKIPFLGSDIPEFNDFVNHQRTGFLFSTKKTEFFINLIQKYDKKLWKTVAQNAHKEFLSKYNLEQMGSSYEKLYSNLLDSTLFN